MLVLLALVLAGFVRGRTFSRILVGRAVLARQASIVLAIRFILVVTSSRDIASIATSASSVKDRAFLLDKSPESCLLCPLRVNRACHALCTSRPFPAQDTLNRSFILLQL